MFGDAPAFGEQVRYANTRAQINMFAGITNFIPILVPVGRARL
jgi:hypothetical protein